MTAKTGKPTGANTPTGATVPSTKPPYPFRTAVLGILLAGNLVIAAIYFHILNP